MPIKIKGNQTPEIASQAIECYKIVKKTFKYVNYSEDGNHFQTAYETMIQSFDVTPYVNGEIWDISSSIKDEISINTIFRFFPKSKTIKEGFIFTLTKDAMEQYVKVLLHNKDLYGRSHFMDDLRIFKCEIPANTVFYSGKNGEYDAYASKSLRFVEDVTKQLF